MALPRLHTVGSVSASASLTVASGAAPVVTGFTNMSVCRQRHADNLHGYRRRGEQLQLVITSECQPGKQTNSLGVGTITVTFASGFTTQANKQIRVTATSVCGTSPMTIYYLLAQNPSTPQPIVASSANVCPSLGTNIPITYTIPKVVGASSYIWNAQSGTTTITHPNGLGVNDTTVTVTFTNGFTTSNITVQAVNSCGTSGGRALTITWPTRPHGPDRRTSERLRQHRPGRNGSHVHCGTTADRDQLYMDLASGCDRPDRPGQQLSDLYIPGLYRWNDQCDRQQRLRHQHGQSLTVCNPEPGNASVIDVVQTTVCPNRIFTYSLASMPANATTVNWTLSCRGQRGITNGIQHHDRISCNSGNRYGNGAAVNNCGSSVIRSATVFLPACPPEEKGKMETIRLCTRKAR